MARHATRPLSEQCSCGICSTSNVLQRGGGMRRNHCTRLDTKEASALLKQRTLTVIKSKFKLSSELDIYIRLSTHLYMYRYIYIFYTRK